MRTILFILPFFLSANIFAQIGNESGEYDSVINLGYEIINKVESGDINSVVKSFKPTDLQSKKELKELLNEKNLQWIKNMIAKYGQADQSIINISKMSSSFSDDATINLTYYFKPSAKDFSLTCDHVSLNFVKKDESYSLNGIMFFNQEEYLMLKQFVDKFE